MCTLSLCNYVAASLSTKTFCKHYRGCWQCQTYKGMNFGMQMHGDKECLFSGVTSCGRAWWKVLESEVWSTSNSEISFDEIYNADLCHALPPPQKQNKKQKKVLKWNLSIISICPSKFIYYIHPSILFHEYFVSLIFLRDGPCGSPVQFRICMFL